MKKKKPENKYFLSKDDEKAKNSTFKVKKLHKNQIKLPKSQEN